MTDSTTFRPIASDTTPEGYPVVHIDASGDPEMTFTLAEAQEQVDATTEPWDTPELHVDGRYIRDESGRVYGERANA